MNEQIQIFVKADLLLHENEFSSLRDFIKNTDLSDLKDFDSFVYSHDGECVIVESVTGNILLDNNFLFFAQSQTKEGFILLSLESLKKFVITN